MAEKIYRTDKYNILLSCTSKKAFSSLYIGKTITFMSVLEQNTKRIVYFLAAIIAFIAGSPLSPVLSETCASIVLFISTQKLCRRMTVVLYSPTKLSHYVCWSVLRNLNVHFLKLCKTPRIPATQLAYILCVIF